MRVGRSQAALLSAPQAWEGLWVPRPTGLWGKVASAPRWANPENLSWSGSSKCCPDPHTVQVRPQDTARLPPRSLPDPDPKVPAEGALATLSLWVQDGGSCAAPEGRGKVRQSSNFCQDPRALWC